MPTPAPSARLPPHHPRPPKPVPGAVPRLNIRPGSRRPRVTRQLPADGTILQGRTDEAMPLAVAGEADAGAREVTAARPAANTRSAQVQAPRPARGADGPGPRVAPAQVDALSSPPARPAISSSSSITPSIAPGAPPAREGQENFSPSSGPIPPPRLGGRRDLVALAGAGGPGGAAGG